MASDLHKAFGPDALRALAWGRSFERGAGYAAAGRVKRLKVGDGEASATVQGAQAYRVRLWLEDGAPRFSCTCPVAADGHFCKHCVAVGLAAFDEEVSEGDLGVPAAPGGKRAGSAGRRRADRARAVRAYLEGLDKARIVDLLLEQADDDELLRGRLELAATTVQGAAGDVARFRTVMRDVICPREFIGYRSMYDYSRGVDDLIQSLARLQADGFAAELVDLCEYALACLEDALGSVDDSDGQMSDIRDRLVSLHHEACVQARPDPVALAERLFERELHSDWEVFLGAAAIYADVLGEAGLAAYRRRAEEVWATLPPLAPGDAGDQFFGRFTITYMMETLAELDGDVDGLVAVKERDLSAPYDFVEIAEIYSVAGRHDDALAWAERGLAAYPDCGDPRLIDVLADEYEHHGRAEDAVLVAWSLLDRWPRLDSYQRLKERAVRAEQWDVWRTRALDRLRAEADAPAGSRLGTPAAGSIAVGLLAGGSPPPAGRPVVPSWGRLGGRSEVVRALLWEGDTDAAWAEAVAGGCTDLLWLQLAEARAGDHPDDALPIYERHVERSIGVKNARGYADAVAGLRRIEELLVRAGRGDEFPAYVSKVRASHKQKRSLLKLVDQAGW